MGVVSAAQLTSLREFAGSDLTDAVLRRYLVRTGGDVNRAAELLLTEKPTDVGSHHRRDEGALMSVSAPSSLPERYVSASHSVGLSLNNVRSEDAQAVAPALQAVKKEAWKRFYKAHLLKVKSELGSKCTRAEVTSRITDNWSRLESEQREELYASAREDLIKAAMPKIGGTQNPASRGGPPEIAGKEATSSSQRERPATKNGDSSGRATASKVARNEETPDAPSSFGAKPSTAPTKHAEAQFTNIYNGSSASVIDLENPADADATTRNGVKVDSNGIRALSNQDVVHFVQEASEQLDPTAWPKCVATRTVSCPMDVRGRNVVRAGERIELVSSGKQFVRMLLNGREIGKLQLSLGRFLAPALASGYTSAFGRVVFAPKVIPFVNGAIDVEVRIYVEKSVFQTLEEIATGKSKAAAILAKTNPSKAAAESVGPRKQKLSGKRGGPERGPPGGNRPRIMVDASTESDGEGIDLARISVESLLSHLGACEPQPETNENHAINVDDAPTEPASKGGVGKFYDPAVEQTTIDNGDVYKHPRQLLCTLRDYQKVAVLWMLNCEKHGGGNFGDNSEKAALIPLWRRRAFPDGVKFYSNNTTGGMSLERPSSGSSDGSIVRGGILGDEMGLGKTVETIGLIVRDRIDLDRLLTGGDAGEGSQSSGEQSNPADVVVVDSDEKSEDISAGDKATANISHEPPTKRAKSCDVRTSIKSNVEDMEEEASDQISSADEVDDVKDDSDNDSDSDFVPERRVPRGRISPCRGFTFQKVSQGNASRKIVSEKLFPSQPFSRIYRLRASEKTGCSKLQGGTLLVVPVSMISQWRAELEKHVEGGFLRVVVHHEQRREARHLSVKQADVVVTTYGVLASEAPEDDGKGGPLFSIEWRRCVLDEAHSIRGRATKQAAACFQIFADRRWCLTGSPIQNHINDAQALLRFLRVEPWSAWGYWRRGILSKVESADGKTKEEGYATLRSVLSPITLRRLKSTLGKDGKPLVKLTERTETVVYLELGDAERDFYETLHAKSKRKFDTFVASGRVTNHWANVFELLLRLRQAVCHPWLVYAASQADAKVMNDREAMFKSFAEAGSAEYANKVLAGDDNVTCPICLGDIEDKTAVKSCGHAACRECFLRLIEKARGTSASSCPSCRAPIESKSDLVTLPRHEGSRFPMDIKKNFQSSAKLDYILSEVRRMEGLRKAAPDGCVGKTVIMSSFTSFIDLIGAMFDRNDIKYLRFDGTLSSRKREAILKAFADDDERKESTAQVLVVSTRSGNQGINLISSSLLLLADPSWNPKVDDQAAARVHRTGQTRAVRISRLIVKNSVEEKLLAVQQQKVEMTEGALATASAEDKKVKIDRMKLLFSR